MRFHLYTGNAYLLNIKSIFKYQLRSNYIHKSIDARKISPQEVNFSNNRTIPI